MITVTTGTRPLLHRPADLAELAGLRHAYPTAHLLGGGTILVPWRHRQLEPPPVIRLPALAELREVAAGRCGAAVTLAELATDDSVPEGLARAAGSVGGPAVRTAATVGGNIAAAAPGCVAVALLALDATVDLLTGDGRVRVAPLAAAVGQHRAPVLAVRWSPTWTVAFSKVRAGAGGPVVVTVAVGGPAGGPPAAVGVGGPGLTPHRASTVECALASGGDLRAALVADGIPDTTVPIAATLVDRAVSAARTGGPR
jgi:CO/xanthine dehydrogenase FAD-binding subunit